jgi:cytochrome c556
MSLVRRARLALPLILVAATTLVGAANAEGAPPSKAEQALRYRKSVLQVMAWNFGPMAAMAQSKMPYDPAQFAARAGRVAILAPMLEEAFPAESQGVANSKLKPEMWPNRADFDSKLKDLEDRSATLAAVARGGDFEKTRAAFFDTANACKACHEKYKAD